MKNREKIILGMAATILMAAFVLGLFLYSPRMLRADDKVVVRPVDPALQRWQVDKIDKVKLIYKGNNDRLYRLFNATKNEVTVVVDGEVVVQELDGYIDVEGMKIELKTFNRQPAYGSYQLIIEDLD